MVAFQYDFLFLTLVQFLLMLTIFRELFILPEMITEKGEKKSGIAVSVKSLHALKEMG